MQNNYRSLFEYFKRTYPKSYSEIIESYIISLKEETERNNLVRVAILSFFRNSDNLHEDHPLSSRYSQKELVVRNLTDKDMRQLADYYVRQVEKLGKEYITC